MSYLIVLEIDGKNVECELTSQGLEEIKNYIAELKAKRKEILDAEKDTADDTHIPTVEDIVSDIECFFDEELVEYCNSWGVTDHYDADWPLHLVFGEDIVKKGV